MLLQRNSQRRGASPRWVLGVLFLSLALSFVCAAALVRIPAAQSKPSERLIFIATERSDRLAALSTESVAVLPSLDGLATGPGEQSASAVTTSRAAERSGDTSKPGNTSSENNGDSSTESDGDGSGNSDNGRHETSKRGITVARTCAVVIFSLAVAVTVLGLCCEKRVQATSPATDAQLPGAVPVDGADGDGIIAVNVANQLRQPQRDNDDETGDNSDEHSALLGRDNVSSRTPRSTGRRGRYPRSPQPVGGSTSNQSGEAAQRVPSLSRRWRDMLFDRKEQLFDVFSGAEQTLVVDASGGQPLAGGHYNPSSSTGNDNHNTDSSAPIRDCQDSDGGDQRLQGDSRASNNGLVTWTTGDGQSPSPANGRSPRDADPRSDLSLSPTPLGDATPLSLSRNSAPPEPAVGHSPELRPPFQDTEGRETAAALFSNTAYALEETRSEAVEGNGIASGVSVQENARAELTATSLDSSEADNEFHEGESSARRHRSANRSRSSRYFEPCQPVLAPSPAASSPATPTSAAASFQPPGQQQPQRLSTPLAAPDVALADSNDEPRQSTEPSAQEEKREVAYPYRNALGDSVLSEPLALREQLREAVHKVAGAGGALQNGSHGEAGGETFASQYHQAHALQDDIFADCLESDSFYAAEEGNARSVNSFSPATSSRRRSNSSSQQAVTTSAGVGANDSELAEASYAIEIRGGAASGALLPDGGALDDDLAFYTEENSSPSPAYGGTRQRQTPIVVFSGGSSVGSHATTCTSATAETPLLVVSTRSGTPSLTTPQPILLPPSTNIEQGEETIAPAFECGVAAGDGEERRREQLQQQSTLSYCMPSALAVMVDSQPAQEELSDPESRNGGNGNISGSCSNGVVEGVATPIIAVAPPSFRDEAQESLSMPPVAGTYTAGGFRGAWGRVNAHDARNDNLAYRHVDDEALETPKEPNTAVGKSDTHSGTEESDDKTALPKVGPSPRIALKPPSLRSRSDREEKEGDAEPLLVSMSVDGGTASLAGRVNGASALSHQEREMLLLNRKWLFPLIDGTEDL